MSGGGEFKNRYRVLAKSKKQLKNTKKQPKKNAFSPPEREKKG